MKKREIGSEIDDRKEKKGIEISCKKKKMELNK